jgi:hypothetical protein
MANNFLVNPHQVDTVMTSTLMATTPRKPATPPIQIVSIYWYNPSAVGDTFQIVDAAGNIIKEGRCEAANQSQEFDMHGKLVGDYKVTTLSSGKLEIELMDLSQEKAS